MGEQIGGDREPRKLMVAVFPPEYIGPVYVALRPTGAAVDTTVQLLWGPWGYERNLTIAESGVNLVFAKTQSGEGQPPLRVVTSEPLIIGVYTGSPDGDAEDCNEGWVPR